MDDDTRAEVELRDNLEADPARAELLALLHHMENLALRAPDMEETTRQALLQLIDRALEMVRLLPRQTM